MLQAVWTVGIVLAVVAAMDRRAWPSLALLALVFVQTAISKAVISDPVWALTELQAELIVRALIDLCAGFLSLSLVTRHRWTWIMPATFSLMVLWHGLYWFAYSIGTDLWLPYVHSENALLIAQVLGLSWLSGGRIGELVCTWYGDLRSRWSVAFGVGAEHGGVPTRNQGHDGDGCSALCSCRTARQRQTDFDVRVSPTAVAR